MIVSQEIDYEKGPMAKKKFKKSLRNIFNTFFKVLKIQICI